MNKESERVFNKLRQYLNEREAGEDFNHETEIEEFFNTLNSNDYKQEEIAWDYFELALEAVDEKEALNYAKKALEMNKNLIDAEVFIAELKSNTNEELKLEYERLIKKAEKYLIKEGIYTDENIGVFWYVRETRPYMRLRYAYMKQLADLGKIKKAIEECKEMLTLSEGDNLGVRHFLIHLYAFMEDEENVIKLYDTYNKEHSTFMLLPIILLYYKLDNYREAKKYLRKLYQANTELKEFFISECIDDTEYVWSVLNSSAYRFASKEELIFAFTNYNFLYNIISDFYLWMERETLSIE